MTRDPANNYSVYVSFHSDRDVDFHGFVARLDAMLSKYFVDAQQQVFADVEQKEVVYRVQKPVFAGEDDMQDFFQNLHFVFTVNAAHQPHFTQYQEVPQ